MVKVVVVEDVNVAVNPRRFAYTGIMEATDSIPLKIQEQITFPFCNYIESVFTYLK